MNCYAPLIGRRREDELISFPVPISLGPGEHLYSVEALRNILSVLTILPAMIEAAIDNLLPHSDLTFSELWILGLGVILQKACFQEITPAQNATNQKQHNLCQITDSCNDMEITRSLSDKTQWSLGACKTRQVLGGSNSPQLNVPSNPPRLFLSHLMASQMATVYHLSDVQLHKGRNQITKGKSCSSKMKRLAVRGTHLVVCRYLQHIQLPFDESSHLGNAIEIHEKWAILEKQAQRHLIMAVLRTVKSQAAKSMFRGISKKRGLQEISSVVLKLVRRSAV